MIEIAKFVNLSGLLSKRIWLGADGALVSDGACVMAHGSAERVHLDGVGALARLIGNLNSNEAIALGALRRELPDQVRVTTARKLLAEPNGTVPADLIARTGAHISYVAGRPALALLDHDTKGMPQAVADRLRDAGGFWNAVVSVAPGLALAGRVTRRSTSSGICRSDTGQPVPGSDGLHVFVHLQDGADLERFLKVLHDRCRLHGFGWARVSASGQLLERSIIDQMVSSPERLVFEGPAILKEPLVQDAGLRAPVVTPGDPVDTTQACRGLTAVEHSRLRVLERAERYRLQARAAEARDRFVGERAASMAAGASIPLSRARQIVERQCEGTLLPNVALEFDDPEMSGATVADVLADPGRFVGATLADPLEGVSYGRCKAKIMCRPNGSMWISSFAHGRTVYDLKHDAASVEAAIMAADPAEAITAFVKLMEVADLRADEEQKLCKLIRERTGVQARPLARIIKAAQREQDRRRAEAQRDSAAASRSDHRLQFNAPPPDAERLPTMQVLDQVLGAVADPEPPMRTLDGQPVEVRCRPPMRLHELTAGGANQAEPERTRLPAPAMPLLTVHDRFSLAHEIEKHVEFAGETKDGIRSVALPPVFVDHYMAYRDSVLPRVGAIVTAPLVLPDGTMLASQGLDRDRRLVFRLPPELLAILPDPQAPLPDAARVARALDFLVNEWLVDVATDFVGKCILVAFALSILERVLLPERPAFFVTAGKRGGGKTTALAMVILAVTGIKPAAAAWSSSEDERRKALLAYLAEGGPALVFDNIPLGTTISCPTIEKILTTESYSDRLLGHSAIVTVSAFTILAFTGNNIGPKGDLASRGLMTRLDVDRVDPENRPFRHADPIAWTLNNRGKILKALYVLLLGNPQLQDPKTPKTRFKSWWHLIGSAVEHAAASLEMAEETKPQAERTARPVDFGSIFASVEEHDEEASSVAEVLEIFYRNWPGSLFRASDVVRLIALSMEGEGEDAARLREFFAPSDRRGSDNVSSIRVGCRLGTIVDMPVRVGDRSMKLVRHQPADQATLRQTTSYRCVCCEP